MLVAVFHIYLSYHGCFYCLQCFDTVRCVSGRASSLWKNWVIRCWHGYLSGARCKWSAYGPADGTATPSSLASLKCVVPAYSGFTGNEAVKWVSVLPGVFLRLLRKRNLQGPKCGLIDWWTDTNRNPNPDSVNLTLLSPIHLSPKWFVVQTSVYHCLGLITSQQYRSTECICSSCQCMHNIDWDAPMLPLVCL